MRYNVGDMLEIANRVKGRGNWKLGERATVTQPCTDSDGQVSVISKTNRHLSIVLSYYELRVVTTKGGSMNGTIAKLFDKTSDALLVEKYLGGVIADNVVSTIVLEDKTEELLAKAKELDEKAKKHE